MEVRMYSSTCCCRSVRPCMDRSLLNMRARVKQRVFQPGAASLSLGAALRLAVLLLGAASGPPAGVRRSAGPDLPELREDLSLERIGVARLATVVLLVRALELL